jgi:hypothetical protein
MFPFDNTILLVGVGARHSMLNSKFLEESVDRAIFTTPIGLNCFNFGIKEPFNIRFKSSGNRNDITL